MALASERRPRREAVERLPALRDPNDARVSERSVKVRPFEEFVKKTSGVVAIAGRIEGGGLALHVAGGRWRLDSVVAQDERGPFALLAHSEDELPLTDGLLVRIRHEYEPGMPPGGEISVFFGSHKPDYAAQSVSMLRIEERPGVAVYFDSDGRVNGTGRIGAEVTS